MNPGQFGIAGGVAEHHLYRPVKAQHLFEEGRNFGIVGANGGFDVGMRPQMGEDDAKQIGCRFNAANQQKDSHVEHFALRQMLAVHLGLDEGADQIAATRVRHPLIIDFLEISTDRFGTAIDLRQSFRRIG